MKGTLIYEELGARLRLLRTLEGVSQQKIAELLYVERSTYTCYELSKVLPPIETLCKMAELFDVNIGYLVGKEELRRGHKYYNLLK